MSAPDTNVEKQKKNHRTPLMGMWISLAVVGLLFVGGVLWYAVTPPSDETGGPLIEGQTQAEPES